MQRLYAGFSSDILCLEHVNPDDSHLLLHMFAIYASGLCVSHRWYMWDIAVFIIGYAAFSVDR